MKEKVFRLVAHTCPTFADPSGLRSFYVAQHNGEVSLGVNQLPGLKCHKLLRVRHYRLKQLHELNYTCAHVRYSCAFLQRQTKLKPRNFGTVHKWHKVYQKHLF